PHTEAQLERFRAALALLRDAGISPRYIHAANSGGLLHFPSSWFDTLRPGIALYGLAPSPGGTPDLHPVLAFKSRLVRIKKVSAGTPLGYGHGFTTTRPSSIGTLAAGYADGLPRLLSPGGAVLVRGRRAPYTGRISMDHCMVDLSGVPDAAEGDEAVLLGTQRHETISADEF